jgi:molybdate transport repressor ModE-like protein
MDTDRLAVLREAARQGSFSGAARTLNLSRSAVSRQVTELERETGMKLVERTSRGVRLTETGSRLVSRRDAVAAHLGVARAEVEALRAEDRTGD